MIPASITWDISLRLIAARIRRNVPQHRDPEAFHVEASQLEDDVLAIAREIEAMTGRRAA